METIKTPLVTKDEMVELLAPHETYTAEASDLLSDWSSSIVWKPTSVTYPATYKTSITTDDISTLTGISFDAAEKKDIEKIERHVDELEQDIDFFSEERKKQEADLIDSRERIKRLEDEVSYLMSENDTLTNRIIYEEGNRKQLQKETDNLKQYLNLIIDKLRSQGFDLYENYDIIKL